MKKYTSDIEKKMKETYKLDGTQAERDEQVLSCCDLIMEDNDDINRVKNSVRGKLASMKHYTPASTARPDSTKGKETKQDIIGNIATALGMKSTQLMDLKKSTIAPLMLMCKEVQEMREALDDLERCDLAVNCIADMLEGEAEQV